MNTELKLYERADRKCNQLDIAYSTHTHDRCPRDRSSKPVQNQMWKVSHQRSPPKTNQPCVELFINLTQYFFFLNLIKYFCCLNQTKLQQFHNINHMFRRLHGKKALCIRNRCQRVPCASLWDVNERVEVGETLHCPKISDQTTPTKPQWKR